MPKTTSRPSTEELRSRAVAEARRLLADGGPDQVKARMLAVRLGVSVGTIYNLFGQLDEVLFLVNGEVYDELLAATEKAIAGIAPGADPADRALALSNAYLDFVSTHQDLWSGVLAFNRRSKPSVPEWYKEKERALLNTAAHALEDIPGPATATERELAARATWAAIHGIVTISVGPHGLIATREDIARQIELIVRAVVKAIERGELAPPTA